MPDCGMLMNVAVRIVICPQSHLLRMRWPEGADPSGRIDAWCPQCAASVAVRAVDARMLSQEGLAEAWQHLGH